MNQPDREDACFQDEDDIKVIIKEDPRLVNAANFIILKEDHTVGNLLRSQLLKMDEVRFAGYRLPHPLETLLELKVQTNGAIPPVDAVKAVTLHRITEINAIEKEFEDALKRFKGEQQHGFGAYM